MDCGKKNKISKQKGVISYFQNPQSNNPHPIHASSSLEQDISERDVKNFENASATKISVREMSKLLRMHLQPIQ